VTYLNEGRLTLIPAPTNAADDAIDGRIDVLPVVPPRDPLDVNANGSVTAEDLLILITELNTQAAAGTPLQIDPTASEPPYLDLTGDGLLTALDLLVLVNFLNEQPGLVAEGEAAASQFQPVLVSPSWPISSRSLVGSADSLHAYQPVTAVQHPQTASATEFSNQSRKGYFAELGAVGQWPNEWEMSLGSVWEEVAVDDLDFASKAHDALIDDIVRDNR
jgi:hypothetical protein